MIVKLAPTSSCRIMTFKKLNNIMIHRLWNLRASVHSEKWHLDLSQDWETFALDFENFSTDNIADKILQALGFHIFAIEYLEEGSPYFINITDLNLTAEPTIIDNLGQVVINSKEKIVKKKNKYAVKRMECLANFVFLLDVLYLLASNSLFLHHLVLSPLLCSLLCLFLFLILDLLLFCHLVVCLLWLLFLVAEFQLFCCRFLCLVHFFFFDLYLLEHSNNSC